VVDALSGLEAGEPVSVAMAAQVKGDPAEGSALSARSALVTSYLRSIDAVQVDP
jgi:hypothetical protein